MIKHFQQSFAAGINQQSDATKLQPNEYPLLINGRSRYDKVQSIKLPEMIGVLPTTGIMQGLYGIDGILLLFQGGKAIYRDFNSSEASYNLLAEFQLSQEVDTIFAEAVPNSSFNFRRVPATDTKNGEVNVVASIKGSPACLIVQDGVNQANIIFPDGQWRKSKNYSQWTMDDSEYVPIGTQMAFTGTTLYIVAPNGREIYRSVGGRALDFMVNIRPDGDKEPNEQNGGAQTVSHSVGFSPITCLVKTNTKSLFVSTLRSSYFVDEDFTRTIFGEPLFKNIPLFDTGCINFFAFLELIGDNTFIDFNGLRSFNGIAQTQLEGQNSPFSSKIAFLFDGIKQYRGCAKNFDNYALFSVNTIYGPGVVVYDTIREAFSSVDIFPNVNGQIKQFAEVVTRTGDRRLFFITHENELYEYFASPTTAKTQLYLGDWCSKDPSIEQKFDNLMVVVGNADESGTLTATLFADGKKLYSTSKAIRKTTTGTTGVYPFQGDDGEDRVQILNFKFQLARQAWKYGVLLEWDAKCEVTDVYMSNETTEDETSDTEKAYAGKVS